MRVSRSIVHGDIIVLASHGGQSGPEIRCPVAIRGIDECAMVAPGHGDTGTSRVKAAEHLTDLDVRDAACALGRGRMTARDLVEACLARIEAHDHEIRAFIRIMAESARLEADASDARRRSGRERSDLDGIPIAVKDNIDFGGVPTTNGFNTTSMPVRDADVVASLRSRGLIVIGKTNLHEGALGATTDNPHHGRTDNPVVRGSTAGGSSGGSAAAVAARFCPAALGTDTMGSVRLPAAYCGIVGFKPTAELWSTVGVAPLAAGLDTVGPLARQVSDVIALMGLPAPAASTRRRGLVWLENLDLEDREGDYAGVFDSILRQVQRAGIRVTRRALPDYDPSAVRRAGLLVSEVEAWCEFESLLNENPAAVSPEFRAMLEYGARSPAPRYVRARKEIRRIGEAVNALLHDVDAIIAPTTPQPGFFWDTPVPATQADFTALANFAGCPSISLPAHRCCDGFPVGLQLVAAKGQDGALLDLAASIEVLLCEMKGDASAGHSIQSP